MTPAELEAILRSIDLQSLSDEEISSFNALFTLKAAETNWIINCRKDHKSHFSSKDNK